MSLYHCKACGAKQRGTDCDEMTCTKCGSCDWTPIVGKPKKPIATVDMDTATYVGNEDDGVYFTVAKSRNGWYVSTLVDCNTSHFTDVLQTDDGPYKTEADAQRAGHHAAVNWCVDNDVVFDGLDDAEPREAQVHCVSCGCDLHDGVCPEGCAQPLDETE
jgi:hypothetical protein